MAKDNKWQEVGMFPVTCADEVGGDIGDIALVALMENQVQELVEKNIPAAALHSELDNRQHWQTLRSHSQNHLPFLCIFPQTLLRPKAMGV